MFKVSMEVTCVLCSSECYRHCYGNVVFA